MPGGDGTGPNGFGPMTGRGLGYCAGYSTPGYTKGPGLGLGRGFRGGRGRGFGRGMAWGRGRRYVAPVISPVYTPVQRAQVGVQGQPASPEAELNMLKQEKDYLESELDNIKRAIQDIGKRMNELETENK
ncbi:MAG: DUF5320 domain-containing protein [Promethearchaeia archaeon]